MKKKAQLTNPNPQSMVSLLIFLIGLFLVIYILFLPPADRADLLEQNRSSVNGEKDIKDDITILMTKEPNRISNVADDEIIHDLPSFNLFTRTDATNVVEPIHIYIKKSLFEEQSRNITFKLDNFENTDNLVLSYSAMKHNGILTMILNDNIIFSSDVESTSPAPLKLPKDYLSEDNEIIFKVSGPGVEFWKSNEYIMQDVKITADITDKTSQENKQIIHVTEQEKDNLESFKMRFAVDCKEIDVGPLEIYLNKRLIFSSVPDCGTQVIVPEVDGSRVRQGENDLLFRTEKGNYLLYGIETTLKLEEPLFPTYFFNIKEEDFNDIENGDADINVTLLFPNSVDRKKGIVLVNDFMLEIETYDTLYSRNINSFVREGNNAIEIQPKTEKLDVVELKVVLAE